MSSTRLRHVAITLFVCVFSLLAESAFATHFRYGYIFWERDLSYTNPSKPNEVKVTVTIEGGGRWSYPWTAANMAGYTSPRCTSTTATCCAGAIVSGSTGTGSCPPLNALINWTGGQVGNLGFWSPTAGQTVTIVARHGITLSPPVHFASLAATNPELPVATTPLDVMVNQVSLPEDTFYGRFVVTILMDKTKPLHLLWRNGARLSQLLDGNNDIDWRLSSIIDLTGPNAFLTKSPKSQISAVIQVTNQQDNTVTLPGVAFDNLVTKWRLATNAESLLTNPVPAAPSVFALDGVNGRVSFRPRATGFYAVQFRLIGVDPATQQERVDVPIDVMFQSVNQSIYTNTLSTTNGQSELTATVGQPISYTVRSTLSPPNAAFQMTVNNTILPAGATVSGGSCNAATGTCDKTFTWTPGVNNTASVVCYTGSITNGLTLVTTAPQKCVTITLNPLETRMTVEPTEGTAGGGPLVLRAKLERVYQAAPLPGRTVHFTYDANPTNPPWIGTASAVTDANGFATAVVTTVGAVNPPSPYTATFNAIANEFLAASAGSSMVSIKRATTSVNAPTTGNNPFPSVGFVLPISAVLNRHWSDGGIYGVGAMLDFTLTAPGGASSQLAGGPTNVSGVATANFPAPTVTGIHTATASFAGNDALNGGVSSGATSFNVRQRTQVTMSAGIASQNASSPVSATLVAIPSGTPLAGKTVTFTTTGATSNTQTAQTDAAGVATVNFSWAALGAKSVTASYTPAMASELNRNGLETGDSSAATTTVVAPVATQVVLAPFTGMSGTPGTLGATLRVASTGAPLPGATVTFSRAGGGSLGSGITQPDGTVSVAFTPGAAVNGEYTATFAGMAGYAATSATASYVIAPAATTLSAPVIAATSFVGDTITAAATLSRDSAPAGAVAGESITFTLLGAAGNPGGATSQTFNGTTNASGVAQVSFPATARGQFTVSASYAGNGSLSASTSADASTTVYQKVQLLMAQANGTSGVATTISAQLVTLPGNVGVPGQTVSFTVPGASTSNPSVLTAADGTASILATFATAGPFTASGRFDSGAFYSSAVGSPVVTASSTVMISRAASALSTPTIVSGQPIVGQPMTFTSALSRVTPPAGPLAGSVTFTITGPGGAVTTLTATSGANGIASTTFNVTARGEHTVSASFAGSESLEGSTSAATAFAASQPTLLTIAPVTAIAGGPATISATLMSVPQNIPVANELVTFAFNNVVPPVSATTDANGVATIVATFPIAGTVVATVTSTVANNYGGSSADTTINVQSAQTAMSTLTLPSTVFVGDTLTVATTVTRTSAPAGPIAGASVIFSLDGGAQTQVAQTDANGNAQASFPVTTRGAHTVTAQYAGDAALAAAQRQASVNAYQKTMIVLNAAHGTAGSPTEMTAQLFTLPDNTPLSNQPVEFSVSGYGTALAVTAANGVASGSLNFNAAGAFGVTASFVNLAEFFVSSNGDAVPTTSTGTVTINRAATALTALTIPANTIVGVPVSVTTQLMRISAPAGPMQNEVVQFTVTAPDGSSSLSGSANTTAGGIASFTFTPAMKGAYTVSASFGATAGADGSASGATSSTTYQRTTLSFTTPLTGLATRPITFSAKLTTVPDGTPLANQQVMLTFNNLQPAVTLTTDAQGAVAHTVTFPATGNYPVRAEFSNAAAFFTSNGVPVTATVVDATMSVTNTPPTFTAMTVAAIEATGANGAIALFTAGGNDAEDGALPAVCVPASGSTFPLGQTTVNCTVSDAAQATAMGSFIVTVQDTTAPVVTVPAIAPTFATSAAGRAIEYTASASDIVDGATPAICTPASGSIFELGQTTVTCTSSDSRGNTASASFVVTVNNNVPTFTPPANITAEATAANGATATFAAMGADVEDGAIAAICAPASGSTFPIGTTTVSCTVTDDAESEASGSFTVKVEDTTAPALTLPVVAPAPATGAGGRIVDFAATAADIVDASPTVVCSPASGGMFPIGDTTVTCTATDDYNNSTSGTFTVSVTNNAPTFTPPSNITSEATGADGALVTFTANGNDLEEGTLAAVCAPVSGSTFPVGTTTVSCTVTDVALATATGSFTVTVGDTTAPVLTLPVIAPAFAGSSNGNVVNYSATALDIVDGVRAVSCTPASGSTFPIATTTVNCSASDTRGNTSTGSFEVSITNTAPTIVDLLDLTGEATGSNGRAFTFTSTGNDAEDGSLTPVCTAASGTFPIGTTAVSCTVTDIAGYTATDSFTITVRDTTAPSVTVNSITVQQTSPAGAAANYTFSATDIVDGSLTPVCTPAAGTTFARGNTTVSCTVTDANGNTGSATGTVTVIDTINPVVTYTGNAGTYTADQTINITCAATDSGSGVASTTCANVTGPAHTFLVGVNTRTATATDNAGNVGTATITFTVTVPPAAVGNVITNLVDSPQEAAKMNATLNQATSAPNANARAAHLNKLKKDIEKEIGKTLTAAEAATLISLLNNLY